jgi:hypothetical protein
LTNKFSTTYKNIELLFLYDHFWAFKKYLMSKICCCCVCVCGLFSLSVCAVSAARAAAVRGDKKQRKMTVVPTVKKIKIPLREWNMENTGCHAISSFFSLFRHQI